MELFDVLLQAGLITSALVVYLIFFRRAPNKKGHYSQAGWNYPLKLLLSLYAVRRWKSKHPSKSPEELPVDLQTNDGWNSITIRASSSEGTLLLAIRKICKRQPIAEATVHIKLSDGTIYRLPQLPDTAVGQWQALPNGWSAGGLKIQVLEKERHMRIIYNGLLTRDADNITQHVRFNFIWASVSKAIHHPKDWSDQLAARALALETWRNGDWRNLLDNWEDGGWVQFGAVQGRFQSYDGNGDVDKNEYLRLRGVRERAWSPHGYLGFRRSVNLMVTAANGTVVQLRTMSYKKVLTECISGSIRFPDYTVKSITSTDLRMAEFGETPDSVPKTVVINLGAKGRNLKIMLRFNEDGGELLSGVPYEHEVAYRTVNATIDESHGTGTIEFGYEPTVISHPSKHLSPAPLLKFLSENEVKEMSYTLSLEDRAAACPNFVGGKSASLALLTTVQQAEGYRVPPGFCLTTRALEKQLEVNPTLKLAVKSIEEANYNYDEKSFKELCNKASELFAVTAIDKDIKSELLIQLNKLRQKSIEENLGPELRFAVRSSAVGEDGETLSAAGQNDTILGCINDDDVLRGIQKCWASMFAFTSSYYRRQNGQPCFAGGGVVVQTLVSPRVAGVLFTRHPDGGDPSRLLITANYGLGESVVSGSVDPDTVIVNRHMNSTLSVSNISLGAKTQRVIASGEGTSIEDVPEFDRSVPCLSQTEIIRLAKLGVDQDKLWGAGRDIEWAICENDIFLLQARPITSLDRWTDEELLHELDAAIMADDEIISFANIGEVIPKPLTVMSHDFVMKTLKECMYQMMRTDSLYDSSMLMTHNRPAISLYNSIYRNVSHKIDIYTRMTEMAVHGHRVANQQILDTALQRNPHSISYKIHAFYLLIKALICTKWKMNDSKKIAHKMSCDTSIQDKMELFEAATDNEASLRCMFINHLYTTIGSSGSQFIAMSILLEGGSDFTIEQCNEICLLFSSGDTMSGEVPIALAKLARVLEDSGRFNDFQAQDPKNAMNWLRENLPHVHLDVCTFLEKHGYRAYMEFDLSTKPWVLVPEELMKLLQTIRANNEEQRCSKESSDKEIIASLKTPTKSSTRTLLRWVLPLCRRTVSHREGTKAHLILVLHKMRLAFIELGKILVKEWYLPDHELIFSFRVHELKEYMITRDPALLRKATQRRQYYQKWCQLKFTELNTGWPEPIKLVAPSVTAGDLKITGTSVCAGEVVARACVVKDLSEVHQLQQGDILITHSTDIGWSPYFPLLTGIVTELGGLISHGAVIAREYGLPCIVAATAATDLFKTGDIVRLSGSTGIIEKVQVEESSVDNDK